MEEAGSKGLPWVVLGVAAGWGSGGGEVEELSKGLAAGPAGVANGWERGLGAGAAWRSDIGSTGRLVLIASKLDKLGAPVGCPPPAVTTRVKAQPYTAVAKHIRYRPLQQTLCSEHIS